MPRPKKLRKISVIPKYNLYKPSGVRVSNLNTINLKVEELEAMKLRDIEKLSQKGCAKKMGVSRQTFQLIIKKAHEKVTKAIINGDAISIEGGDYVRKFCIYHCNACEEEFRLDLEDDLECPNCESNDLSCAIKDDQCQANCENC